MAVATEARPETPPGNRATGALARLPDGTVERAASLLAAGSGEAITDHHRRRAEALLVAPLVTEPDWPDPTDPLPFAGGAVHADLIDDDVDTFAELRASVASGPSPSPQALVELAQACRLPVTPYVDRSAPRARQAPRSETPGAQHGGGSPRRSQGLVIDLSTHWAGPLATAMLAEVGWRVIKVDSDARPDGFRVRRGLFAALNATKDERRLDLRQPADRDVFEHLLRGADLLVSSFSPRVLPNLGYDHQTLAHLAPQLRTIAISAFDPAGPRRDWVAYGPGVHAASGLADHGEPGAPRFRACPIAYPDALAGLQAFATANNPTSAAHETVSLECAIAPLLRSSRDGGR